MCEWTWNEWKKVTLRDHCLFTPGPHLLQASFQREEMPVCLLSSRPLLPRRSFNIFSPDTRPSCTGVQKGLSTQWNFAHFSQSEGYLLYKEIKAVPASVTQRSFNQVTLRQYCKNIVRKPHIQLRTIVKCQP